MVIAVGRELDRHVGREYRGGQARMQRAADAMVMAM